MVDRGAVRVTPQLSIEIARSRPDGWRIYFAAYRRPLRIYAFGRWLVGRPW